MFYYLETQNDHNNFLSAAILAALLPVLQNDTVYDARANVLLGKMTRTKSAELDHLLRHCPSNQKSPTSLSKLIDELMRPNLLRYFNSHQELLLPLFDSDDAFEAEINAIKTGQSVSAETFSQVLSLLLNSSVRICDDIEQAMLGESSSSSCSSSCASSSLSSDDDEYDDDEEEEERNEREIIAILRFNSQFHALIDSEKLSADVLQQLQPSLKQVAPSRSVAEIRDELISIMSNRHFNDVLQALFKAIPQHLASIREHNGNLRRPTGFSDPLTAPVLTETGGRTLRLELQDEVHHAQRLLKSNTVQLRPSQPIGNSRDWNVALAKPAGFGALAATAHFDVAVILGLFSAEPLALGSLVIASLPFFIGTFALTLGVSVVGKYFAIEYEKAIRAAKSYIDAGNYVDAAHVLDVEFSQWFGLRAARYAFLNDEHFAMAHFFRGACAVLDEKQRNSKRAYDEFSAAVEYAKKTNQLSLLIVTQLQKITLLKKAAEEEPGVIPIDPETAQQTIDQIIHELMELSPDSFADLYWQLNDKIEFISKRLLNPTRWSIDEITAINQYLVVDGLFILQHFANGRGQLMEVFLSFFQSIVLAYIHQTDPAYLKEATQTQLSTELKHPMPQSPEDLKEFVFDLMIKKMQRCAVQLHAFKQQQSEALASPGINRCIAMIEGFINELWRQYFDQVNDRQKTITADLNDMTYRLNLNISEINRYIADTTRLISDASTYLAQLSADFAHPVYQSISDLLDAITEPGNSLVGSVSSKTGDTMLHRLIDLPLTDPALKPHIQAAVKCSLLSRYVRNHRHETPISILKKSADPHDLLRIIDVEQEVKISDTLERLDEFLQITPSTRGTDHYFLLLEGVHKTDKINIVRNHLRKQGYSVHDWNINTDIEDRKIQQHLRDNPTKPLIIFMDDLVEFLHKSEGFSEEKLVQVFLHNLQWMKANRVIFIGAVTCSAQLPPLILRYVSATLHFSLPNQEQLTRLFNFLFRYKKIEFTHIKELAKIAVGYSKAQIEYFVLHFLEETVTRDLIVNHFNHYASTLRKQFKESCGFAELIMPSFENEKPLVDIFSSVEEFKVLANRLKTDLSVGQDKHLLLYGPKGSGKKTAAKILARSSGRAFILINAEEYVSKNSLKALLDQAIQHAPAILFFEDFDKIARASGANVVYIQAEMVRMIKHDVLVIGATSDSHYIDKTILSHFSCQIPFSQLSVAELNKPLRTILSDSAQQYPAPVYFEKKLANELNVNATQLKQESVGLNLHQINTAIHSFLSDLSRANQGNNGLLYLRYQDIRYSILRMKVQEGIATASEKQECNQSHVDYIDAHRNSLFPGALQHSCYLISPNALDYCYITEEENNAVEQFLEKLNGSFGLNYTAVDDWLMDLAIPESSIPDLVAPETGNTMLHMLVQLPQATFLIAQNIDTAAKCMKHLIYTKNKALETPLYLLMQNDPYELKQVVFPAKILPVGTEITQVDAFIQHLEANIQNECHFLLLEGPPGNGKSETALTHLRAKDYIVHEWQKGAEGDKWTNGLITRVIEFFQKGIAEARKATTSKAVCLFIDEISGVCPQITNNIGAEQGFHDHAAVVEEFQQQISALKGHRVIVIGATNYPRRISSAMLDRAHRIMFPLPDETARLQLFTHFFRFKCISIEQTQQLAKMTDGWSIRHMMKLVDLIKEEHVSYESLNAAFEITRKICEADFRKDFKHAHLMLPQLTQPIQENTLDKSFITNDDIQQAFQQLRQYLRRPDCYTNVRVHTLLYGPPGGGKTTAIRAFAQNCNCAFILIETGISVTEIEDIFERAKTYTSAIICIDEFDKIAFDGSPFKTFLQEQMDGFYRNRIIIVGATNYPARIAEPIFDRIGIKQAVPLPTPQQRGLFIQQILREHLSVLQTIQPDSVLSAEIQNGCPKLSLLADGFSFRGLTNSFGLLLENLKMNAENGANRPRILTFETIASCLKQIKANSIAQIMVKQQAEQQLLRRGLFPSSENIPPTATSYRLDAGMS